MIFCLFRHLLKLDEFEVYPYSEHKAFSSAILISLIFSHEDKKLEAISIVKKYLKKITD